MSKPKLAVRFFRSALGREPVRDWLRALSDDARKSIGDDIRTVQFGWPIGMPLVEKLDGFIKKSQKIPQDELETARRRRRLL